MKNRRLFFSTALLIPFAMTGCALGGSSHTNTPSKFYEVTFMCEDSMVNGWHVKEGELCEPLDRVDKDYYTFEGWYTDTTYKTEYDFSKPITQNVTVYAKMRENTIKTVDDLIALNDSTLMWRVKNDIDCSSVSEWIPITNFSGSLDGQDHTISGINITENSNYIGLFGRLYGYILNLNVVVNINVAGENTNSSAASYFGVGGICGGIESATKDDQVKNVSVKGTVYAPNRSYVGGVIGNSPDRIVGAINEATVTGKDCVGGIIGKQHSGNGQMSTSGIFDCVNKGAVTGGSFVGGIVGAMNNNYRVDDKNLYQTCWRNTNEGAVSGTKEVGGIIGEYISEFKSEYIKLSLKECVSKGSVTSENEAAGLVGRLRASFIDYWSTNTVTAAITGNPSAKLYIDNAGNPHN